MNKANVLVIGAGVSGLSTAILLLKKGYTVTIWAKDLPPNTTSNKAAALWYPYLCFPREKAIPWSKSTFEYLQQEIMNQPESGCIYRTVTEIFDTHQPEPWWRAAFDGPVERPTITELPPGYTDGYRIKTIVIDTSIYMDFLVSMFKKLGGTLVQKEISSFSEAFADCKLVVNCTGLGSKTLCDDDQLYPVRGQMIKIKANGFEQVVVDDDGPNTLCLAVPRVNDIMIGGTAQKDNWNTEVDPADTAEILRKVRLIAPTIGEIEVISESVGLRPVRKAIRLEAEQIGDNTVVHNYGHGGSGFTLSWGCAQDAVALVEKSS